MSVSAIRRGECPTLSAPMQTGDGLLARLNMVDGGLTPKQLIGLAKAAERHGNGLIEITQRGSLQIRGLTAGSAVLMSAEVDALGISVRSGVPVETGPLAGLDPDEIDDPRPIADALRSEIVRLGLGTKLGPKVSVVVDGGGRSMLDLVAGDVRLTALGGDRWLVRLAGDDRGAAPVAVLPADAAVSLTMLLLTAIAALGRTGRGRNVDIDRLRSTLPPSVLPDISPARGEIGSVGDWRNPSGRPISPPEGGMPVLAKLGRTEGGNLERALTNPLRLTDGRYASTTGLPFGSISADVLIAFCGDIEQRGARELRLAPQRTLIVLSGSQAADQSILDAARLAGFIVDPDDPRASIATCAGAPACASGHIPAREIASDVASGMSQPLDLHVSGCEKRCAKPGHDGLTLLGTPAGVGLVLEALDREPIARVASGRAEAAIGRVARLVAAERQMGETTTACLTRIGRDRLATAFVQEPV